ncbi:sugar ABC transporter ATP-binding protein [Aureimonas altamirensis]|uniref:Monosaccharide ABC transporter ATP-binding protein, CUT2 family (TC 3.A.1.2.-) n=1 Tax=Aureimonas altamirensis DSM 21988 TaxID=1121026 RepID=A0ABY1IQH9_9HYPH|nr:sugar ABC transporter ATP-binding protein [Aureimonas altamirensis]SHJ91441.1 monosaccharide ABC transporter ATP-binding protein, CUT2 family (TC 3.A.1.2.-) [Aureimonas altamirensis DSM 21988]
MTHAPASVRGDAPPLLALDGIVKTFPGVRALGGVSFDLRPGEVHAVCGENGAGKSTLMKVIGGLYQADEGRILLDGEETRFTGTRQSEAAGIAIIHQELNLVPHLSVAENIFLAREPKRGPFIDRARLNREAKALLERLKVAIAPTAEVRSLSIAQSQMVEIAKALSLNARVLIMDEPTSSLTESETSVLFRIIKNLKSAGVGIIYISHRLDEMAEIVDRVTVLRDGTHVSTRDFADTSVDEIVSDMVGRSLEEKFPPRTSTPTAEVLFSAEGLTRKGVFADVSFDLRRGEILGFAGLMGAGRTEVARAIFGADPLDAGTIRLGDRTLSIASPRDAIREGIAYLSEDRKGDGLALKMTVADNITLPSMDKVSGAAGFIRFGQEQEVARDYIARLSIRTPSARQVTRLLSGGNQQKIVIAKWLYRGSRILFFDEPTRGIDVGAKYAIYELMDALAADGFGIVLISSELPEILGVTDRIAVFHEGRVMATLDTAQTNQEDIMHYASGYSRPVAQQRAGKAE